MWDHTILISHTCVILHTHVLELVLTCSPKYPSHSVVSYYPYILHICHSPHTFTWTTYLFSQITQSRCGFILSVYPTHLSYSTHNSTDITNLLSNIHQPQCGYTPSMPHTHCHISHTSLLEQLTCCQTYTSHRVDPYSSCIQSMTCSVHTSPLVL